MEGKGRKMSDPQKNNKYVSRVIGNYSNLPELPELLKLPELLELTNKDKLLIQYIEPKTIKSACDNIGIDKNLGVALTDRKDKDSSLVIVGYVKKVDYEGKAPKYEITEEGITYLKSKYDSYKQKKDIEKAKYDSLQDIQDRIKKASDFFETKKTELVNNKGLNYIDIDFNDISRFSPELAERFLDNPEECFKELELGLEDFNEDYKDLKIRPYNLPNTQKINIGELRTEHLNKAVKIIGSPIVISEVRPKAVCAKFECPSCGNIINILQTERQFKEPTKCGCGRKGKFRLLEKELKDSQGMKDEELGEQLGARTQQKTINVFLTDDLTHIENQPFFENSQPIIINGILKEVPVYNRKGQLATFDLMIECFSLEFDDSIRQVTLTEEIKKECKELSKDKDNVNNLVKSFAPNVYNREKEKEGILLSIVSGGNPDSKFRDDSHLLMVGDPGTAKSSLALEIQKVCPGSRWISGKGTTGAGLIGTVTKDNDFGGNVVLQKGALAMANQNICIVDELDKMGESNTDALHEALENQSCSIDKWNKHQKFRTDTTNISCANPKGSRFKRDESIIDQINLPKSLIDRFDIVMAFFDNIGKQDKELADKICKQFKGLNETEDLVSSELLRNYLFYARTCFNPILTTEADQELKKYFIALRAASLGSQSRISVSPRNMGALIRLTRARAKLRLSNTATIEDAKAIIKLYDYFMRQLDLDIEDYKAHDAKEESV